MQTQNEWVLKQLRRGRKLTAKKAMDQRGISRLGARIWDVRREGFIIHSRIISVRNRYKQECHVSEYWMS